MKQKPTTKPVLLLTALILFSQLSGPLSALNLGQTVSNVKVRSSNDNPTWIPHLGKKVITVMYVDPDKDKMNEPFQKALEKAKFPTALTHDQAIVNLKDTWFPNSVVRTMIRSEESKYKVKIFTDPAHILKRRWGLGNCNDTYVVVIIGKDKKVKYIKKGRLNRTEINKALTIIRSEIKK